MNITDTYTVFKREDSDIICGRGLTAVEAMDAILTDDQGFYEIRSEMALQGERAILWAGDASTSRVLKRIPACSSYAADEAAAEDEIAKKVIENVSERHWLSPLDCQNDEDFDLMLSCASDQNGE